jgi:endogenous inhibitor of DNA gyrase (YacG/DUF329 family)
MPTHACPICKGEAESERAKNPYWPFCSRRCKTVDLGGWLDHRYRIPADEQDDDGDGSGGNGPGDGQGASRGVPPRGEGDRNA